jgi:hypothetical protein
MIVPAVGWSRRHFRRLMILVVKGKGKMLWRRVRLRPEVVKRILDLPGYYW